MSIARHDKPPVFNRVVSVPKGNALSASYFPPTKAGGTGTCYIFKQLPKLQANQEADGEKIGDAFCSAQKLQGAWSKTEETYDSRQLLSMCSLAHEQATGTRVPCAHQQGNTTRPAMSFTMKQNTKNEEPQQSMICARPRGVGRVANALAKTPSERRFFARLIGWDQGAMQDPHYASGAVLENSMVSSLTRISKGENADDVFHSVSPPELEQWQRSYWRVLVKAYNMYNTDPAVNDHGEGVQVNDLWRRMSCSTNFDATTHRASLREVANFNTNKAPSYHADTWQSSGAPVSAGARNVLYSSCSDVARKQDCKQFPSCIWASGACNTVKNVS